MSELFWTFTELFFGILLAVAAIIGMRFLILMSLRGGRDRRGMCPNCGYLTKGLTSHVCPECGYKLNDEDFEDEDSLSDTFPADQQNQRRSVTTDESDEYR